MLIFGWDASPIPPIFTVGWPRPFEAASTYFNPSAEATSHALKPGTCPQITPATGRPDFFDEQSRRLDAVAPGNARFRETWRANRCRGNDPGGRIEFVQGGEFEAPIFEGGTALCAVALDCILAAAAGRQKQAGYQCSLDIVATQASSHLNSFAQARRRSVMPRKRVRSSRSWRASPADPANTTLPEESTHTVSAIAKARAVFCSIRTMAMPSSRRFSSASMQMS